jgi:hypothetical protein
MGSLQFAFFGRCPDGTPLGGVAALADARLPARSATRARSGPTELSLVGPKPRGLYHIFYNDFSEKHLSRKRFEFGTLRQLLRCLID